MIKINQQNEAELAKIVKVADEVSPLEDLLIEQTRRLSDEIDEAQRQLFRFGFLSHFWKWICYQFRGYYYTQQEMKYVDQVEVAIRSFLSPFMNYKKPSRSRSSSHSSAIVKLPS